MFIGRMNIWLYDTNLKYIYECLCRYVTTLHNVDNLSYEFTNSLVIQHSYFFPVLFNIEILWIPWSFLCSLCPSILLLSFIWWSCWNMSKAQQNSKMNVFIYKSKSACVSELAVLWIPSLSCNKSATGELWCMPKIKDRRNEERKVYMCVGRPILNWSNCVSFGTALAF